MEHTKITPQILRATLQPHLRGTRLGKLIDHLNPEADAQGNVSPRVLRNIRNALSNAMETTDDDTVKGACGATLEELHTLLGE